MKLGFVYENENTCLVIENENLYTIHTEDAKSTVEIANRIIRGEDTSCYQSTVVEEIKTFININFTTAVTKDVFFYSNVNVPGNYSRNKEEFLKSKKPKIFYLSGISSNELKNFFPMKITNAVGVINIDNVLLVTPFLTSSNACLNCIIERWIESNPDIYQYKGFHDNKEHVSFSDTLLKYGIDKSLIHLQNEKKTLSIIKKSNMELVDSRVLSRESCSACFGINLKETSDFIIDERKYLLQGNGHRSNSYHRSMKILEELVNPLGPVVELEEYGFNDRLDMAVFQSVMSYNPLQKSFPYHGGKGPDFYQAKLSAIGEAMERYNARQFGNEKFIYNSYNHLFNSGANVLSPKSLCLDEKYPFPYDDNISIEWVEGRQLSDFKKVFIPANAVFFLYSPIDKTLQFMPQDTIGLASGLNIEESILQGLLEIIERDAYAIYYRNQLPTSTIELGNTGNIKLESLVQNLRDNEIDIHVKFLKNDLSTYVVHCTTEDKNKKFPVYTHGAGASLDPNIAITRAITEAIQLRTSQIEIQNHKEQFKDDQEYEAYFEWGNGNQRYVGNLLHKDGDKLISINDLNNTSTGCLKADIEKLVRELKSIGYEVYVCDLSRRDNPVKTVRVIVPGFQPTDDTLRRNTERMMTLPAKLGFKHSDILFNKPLFS